MPHIVRSRARGTRDALRASPALSGGQRRADHDPGEKLELLIVLADAHTFSGISNGSNNNGIKEINRPRTCLEASGMTPK